MRAGASERWMQQGACVDRANLPWLVDAEIVSGWDALTMREVCATCPVLLECVNYAETVPVTGGWWAGRDRDLDAVPVPMPGWARWPRGVAQGVLPLSVSAGSATGPDGAA